MKASARILLKCYNLLLALYPNQYRNEYGEELRDVYTLALEDASAKGFTVLVRCALRDLWDMPGAIYHEHLREFRSQALNTRGEKPMAISFDTRMRSPVGRYPAITRLELFLAILPHILFMFLTAGNQLLLALAPSQVDNGGNALPPSMAWVVGIIFIGFFMYAWRHRWPLWSASWLGYWAWIVLIIVTLVNERLALFVSWQFNNFLILGSIGLLALGYLWLVRKDHVRGLLAVLFLMPMLSLSFLEFIPPLEEGLLYLGTGLIVTLTTLTVLILRDAFFGTLLALVANLLVGFGSSYVSVFRPEYPKEIFHNPTLREFFIDLSFYSGLAFLLIAGPLAFWVLWDLAKSRRAS